LNPLSTFDGENARGTWRLEISTDSPTDLGRLTDWSLTFDPVPQTPPDLLATAFGVFETSARFGDSVSVGYSLANQGNSDAGPFNVDVVLSADSTIDASDVPLTRFQVPGLAIGETKDAGLVVKLPDRPPPGFEGLDRFSIGLRINPDNLV